MHRAHWWFPVKRRQLQAATKCVLVLASTLLRIHLLRIWRRQIWPLTHEQTSHGLIATFLCGCVAFASHWGADWQGSRLFTVHLAVHQGLNCKAAGHSGAQPRKHKFWLEAFYKYKSAFLAPIRFVLSTRLAMPSQHMDREGGWPSRISKCV